MDAEQNRWGAETRREDEVSPGTAVGADTQPLVGEHHGSLVGRAKPRPARLSVNISRATEEALLELMDEKGVSMTEAVRRLVGYGSVVYRAVREGDEVLIRRNGQAERVVLLD